MIGGRLEKILAHHPAGERAAGVTSHAVRENGNAALIVARTFARQRTASPPSGQKAAVSS